jgi:two-component sensor histidine kinase
LAIAVPLLLMLGALLFQTSSYEQEQTRQQIARVLGTLTDSLDRDLDRHLTVLQTLATSAALQREDWPRFYDEAKAALQGRAYVVLVDAAGRQLVNTYVPHGQEPATTGDPETVRRMAERKQPVVSNLFNSLVVKKPVVNVSIPVLRAGELRFVLSLGLLPDDLASLLRDQKLDSHWVSLIWDAHNVVLARSRDNEDYVGRPLPEHMRAQSAGPSVVRTINLDGEDVLYATGRSRLSDWSVGVNVPIQFLERQSHITLWLAAATLVAIILAVGLGMLFARALTRPLAGASAAAIALGRGKPFDIVPSRLAEANTVNEALQAAQRELAERSRAEAMLIGELQHRTNNLLTVVQAIAQKSLAGATSVDDAKATFESRLQALARVHRQLTSANWAGINLDDIVRASLAPYAARINMDGAAVKLDAKDAQSFSLAIHELATNAVKYGALSNAHGTVDVDWAVNGEADRPVLNFKWSERGGPPVTPPQRHGFGTSLLRATFSNIKLDYASAGLNCEIQMPLRGAVLYTPEQPAA